MGLMDRKPTLSTSLGWKRQFSRDWLSHVTQAGEPYTTTSIHQTSGLIKRSFTWDDHGLENHQDDLSTRNGKGKTHGQINFWGAKPIGQKFGDETHGQILGGKTHGPKFGVPLEGKILGVAPARDLGLPIDSRVIGLGPKRKQQTVQVRCSHIFSLEQPHCGCNGCKTPN